MITAPASRDLREYQRQCVNLTCQAIATQDSQRHFYYVLPTGTGKTRVAAGIIEKLLPWGRIIFLAHRQELIRQAAASLQQDLPDARVGIIMGEECDLQAEVYVASVQTLARGRMERIFTYLDTLNQQFPGQKHNRLVAMLIDECHHVSGENSYAQLVGQLAQKYPKAAVVGCTATPYRGDKLAMQDILPTCTFTRSIPEMQQANYLAPVSWFPIFLQGFQIDTTKLSSVGGEKDYSQAALVESIGPHLAEIVTRTYPLLEQRPTIIFAASVEHAKQLAEGYNRLAMPKVLGDLVLPPFLPIWGEMPDADRKFILTAWRRGQIQGVVNVGILTEGFDYQPEGNNQEGLAAMVIARPTMSPGLYLQMVGRGTRLKPGKYQDCRVIDVAGNANLLESRQILVPKIFSETIAEELAEMLEYPELADAPENMNELFQETQQTTTQKKTRPVKLKELDPEKRTWLSWGHQDTVYYTDTMAGSFFVCKLDPVSGLYWGYLLQQDNVPWRWKLPEKLVGRSLPLHELFQHINQIVAASGNRRVLDKGAAWRHQSPGEKQLNYLAKLDSQVYKHAVQEHWTKGEVGLAISWSLIKSQTAQL